MPNRIIREAILTSAPVCSLGWPEEVFYRRLMSVVDDYGRCEAMPQLLRSRCYPLQTDQVRVADITRWMAACQKAGVIVLYEVSGKQYLQIEKFGQQQRSASKCPPPPASASRCEQMIAADHLDVSVFGGVDDKPSALSARSPTIPCPYDRIVALYHEALPSLPRVKLMQPPRQKALRKAWGWVLSSTKSDGARRATTADEALEWLRGYFVRAGENDFLMGRSPRSAEHANWQCDIDFLLTDKGMKLVIEKTEKAA